MLKEVSRWLVMGLVGILTALIACLIDVLVVKGSDLKYTYVKKCILLPVFSLIG
jgi:hypothetical protein